MERNNLSIFLFSLPAQYRWTADVDLGIEANRMYLQAGVETTAA